jgi:DNA-binding MarR family transcriptional regulator
MPNYYGSHTQQHLRLWLKLLKTASGIETMVGNRMKKEAGITLPRFDVLAALDHHPDGLRMSELSSFLRVSNGNVTGIANRLVEEKLVARHTDIEDGRVQILCLTELGKQQFVEIAQRHAVWIDELLAPFGDQEMRQTMVLLDKIQQQLRK